RDFHVTGVQTYAPPIWLGISSTARVLQNSTTSLLKRIISIASKIPRPFISKGKVYEVDELRTYLKSKTKLIWIVYALERKTKRRSEERRVGKACECRTT